MDTDASDPDRDRIAIEIDHLVREAIIRHDTELLDRPHIVICTPRGLTDETTYLGPYPTAAAALEGARLERLALLHEVPGADVELRIAALLPAPDTGEPE